MCCWRECTRYNCFRKLFGSLINTNLHLTHDSSVLLLLGIYSRIMEAYIHTETCPQMFVQLYIYSPKTRTQMSHSGEWICELWYISTNCWCTQPCGWILKHHVEWKKPSQKAMHYMIQFKSYSRKANYRYGEQVSACRGVRVGRRCWLQRSGMREFFGVIENFIPKNMNLHQKALYKLKIILFF